MNTQILISILAILVLVGILFYLIKKRKEGEKKEEPVESIDEAPSSESFTEGSENSNEEVSGNEDNSQGEDEDKKF